MALSYLAIALISTFFECVLYGLFFLLSTASLVLLIRRHKDAYKSASSSHSSSWKGWIASAWNFRRSPLILASILLLVTSTAHCVITAHRLILVTTHDQRTREQEEDFLSDLGETTQIIRLVLLFLDMLIGDLVITYRVWLVWERQRGIIAFPVVTTVALVVAGIGLIHQFVVSTPSGSVFDPIIIRWITAYLVMTFCTNTYGTVVIAYRIWASNRALKDAGLLGRGHSHLEAMAIFVESAALYTTYGIFYAVVYGTGSRLEGVGTGCAPPVLGVTFMLITARVGLGWAHESKTSSTEMSWAAAPRSRVERDYHLRSIVVRSNPTIEGQTDRPVVLTTTKLVRDEMEGDGALKTPDFV